MWVAVSFDHEVQLIDSSQHAYSVAVLYATVQGQATANSEADLNFTTPLAKLEFDAESDSSLTVLGSEHLALV